MSNIQPANLAQLDSATAQTLQAVKAKLGVLPNMFLTFAHNPIALNAYLQLSEQTGKGQLSAKQREQIALVVGQRNDCGYCVAAHSVIGSMVGLTPSEVHAARKAQAANPRDQAVLELASAIVAQQGKLSARQVSEFQALGLKDADILEVLLNVVLNIFTNYTNHIADTEIDFPVVGMQLGA